MLDVVATERNWHDSGSIPSPAPPPVSYVPPRIFPGVGRDDDIGGYKADEDFTPQVAFGAPSNPPPGPASTSTNSSGASSSSGRTIRMGVVDAVLGGHVTADTTVEEEDDDWLECQSSDEEMDG